MVKKVDILYSIKNTIHSIEPSADVILYGSRARGDQKEDSDFDILILLDKIDITVKDKKRLTYPLYDIEFDTGKIISPIVLSKNDWETRHKITPFYENVSKDGIRL